MADAEVPVDLTGSDVDYTLGLSGEDGQMPPPGMTMDEVLELLFDRYGAECDLREGDRLRLASNARVKVTVAFSAPGSGSATAILPGGTEFVVTMDPAPTAIGFPCDAVDYEAIERIVVPRRDRRSSKYGGFGFVFLKRDVGRHLIRLVEDDD